jgi:hypothetical protein
VRDLLKRVRLLPKEPAGEMTRLDGWQHWRDDNAEAIPKVLISVWVRMSYWWLRRSSDWNSQLRLLFKDFAILSLKWGSRPVSAMAVIEPQPWYRMYKLPTICESPLLISELCFRSQLCPRKWQEDSVIFSL